MKLDAASARQRFAGVRVARLATVGPDGCPHIVPCTFALGSAPGPVPDSPVPDSPVPDSPVPDSPVPDRPVPDSPVPDSPVECIYSAVDAKPKSSTDLRRLRNIRANPRVAVLADHYEDDWGRLWWVRADGQAAILDGPAEMAPALALLAARYPQYRGLPPGGPVISIRVTRWTGWNA